MRLDLIETVRFWPASLFSIVLTVFFYTMLAGFYPPVDRLSFTGKFVGLGVLGVSLFHLGTRVAGERLSDWNNTVRAFASPWWVRYAARMSVVFFVACLSSLSIAAAGAFLYGLDYDTVVTAAYVLCTFAALIICAPICACMALLLHPQVTPVATTIVYLANAWAAGFWSGSRGAPSGMIESILPIGIAWDLALSVVEMDWESALWRLIVLLLFAVGGFMLTGWLYRRDEGVGYR